MKDDCFVFVTVRLDSKRLPKKALRKINGKPLIKILIDRIKTGKKVKKVVICTTKRKSDDELVTIFKKSDTAVFRGSNLDVLDRLYNAAKKYEVEHFVEVDGDDLFCEPDLIDKTCSFLSKKNNDFIVWEDLPFGVSPIGIKMDKLESLIKKKTTKNTETGWGEFIIKSNLFNVIKVKLKNNFLRRPDLRLTIDYKEDFILARKLLKKLPNTFSLKDVIKLMEKYPELKFINKNMIQKYQKNFKLKKAKIKLKNS